ncbi:hypothetical protein R3P38DRAFT_2783845 [Favolaschia claudopus]|uniref:Uncharacterized protein n=1 Tax=Favolaschia claudopus TaxID=2862362 RepID=A0AAW0B031_9AGAR
MSFQLPAFSPMSSMLPMVAMPVVAPPCVVVMYVPVVAAPAVALAPAPPSAPAAAPKAKDHKESAPPAPKEKATPSPGAGLPAALIQHLRTEGPYTANEIFITVPSQPLASVPEPTPVPEWYVITRGRFVGVVDQYALSDVAISGVAGVRKVYNSQAHALEAFNSALSWGIVQVV